MDKVINVVQCGGCPLSAYNGEYNEHYCVHPDITGNPDIHNIGQVLDNCPLKKEKLTIQLISDAKTKS